MVATLFIKMFGWEIKFLELVIKYQETFVWGGILLPNIYSYSSFLMKLHLCPLLLLMYFAFNSSVAGIYFRFFKKRSLSYRFFLFTPLRNHQILDQVESYCGKTAWELTGWILLHSSVLLKIGGKSHAFPMW